MLRPFTHIVFDDHSNPITRSRYHDKLKGRKQTIIAGGFTIPRDELQQFLAGHPGARLSAVIHEDKTWTNIVSRAQLNAFATEMKICAHCFLPHRMGA